MIRQLIGANKTLLIVGFVTLGIVGIAIKQQLQNREVVQKCTSKLHKVIYVESPLGDQALCIQKVDAPMFSNPSFYI